VFDEVTAGDCEPEALGQALLHDHVARTTSDSWAPCSAAARCSTGVRPGLPSKRVNQPHPLARKAWEFLIPYVRDADVYVFSRQAFAWEGLDKEVTIIPPSIDAFAPKNQELDRQQACSHTMSIITTRPSQPLAGVSSPMTTAGKWIPPAQLAGLLQRTGVLKRRGSRFPPSVRGAVRRPVWPRFVCIEVQAGALWRGCRVRSRLASKTRRAVVFRFQLLGRCGWC
jgi:hypothetical protein